MLRDKWRKKAIKSWKYAINWLSQHGCIQTKENILKNWQQKLSLTQRIAWKKYSRSHQTRILENCRYFQSYWSWSSQKSILIQFPIHWKITQGSWAYRGIFYHIQTLYADTNLLDLVSCFMNKNPQGEKPHKDPRDTLVAGFQNYNWETDPLKLKSIKEAAEILPDSQFQEPNFISIKTVTSRTVSLI